MATIEWPPPRRPQRRGRLLFFGVLAALVFGGGTSLSYYVESLWFDALGFSDVFWKTLNLQFAIFASFAVLTFAVLFGTFLALKPARLGDLTSGTILINGQPVTLPVEPVLRLIASLIAAAIAGLTGLGMMAQWTTLSLYWYGAAAATTAGSTVDPIFGRPLAFYLFTYPAWRLIAGWLTTLAVLTCVIAVLFSLISSGTRTVTRRTVGYGSLRGVSFAFAGLLLAVAAQVYLGRYARILTDHQIFAGVTYTEAHVTIGGLLFVVGGLVAGALISVVNGLRAPKLGWIVASVAPAAVAYVAVTLVGWYVSSFIVGPNQLVRERPYIASNIEFTRQAYALDRLEEVPFPANVGLEAVDAPNNEETLQNIRLWDWRALQDTLRQIQAIRTYYDFADIDIDRYRIDGMVQQVMIATRELNVERLPESSRNWINEKLIYTHGYGVTMNSVNGFTPAGGPKLMLGNMPVESTVPDLKLTRPQIYFGELTNTDVYVRTGQQEFDFPQGDTNSLTSYEGEGGIRIGGIVRRLLIALDQGDIATLPFSDDVNADSRLLMRRNIRARAETLAPFLTFDDDPYIVVTSEGRLTWMMDAFTTSASYPYSRHYRMGRGVVNYLRNSVKATVDAYDGTVVFYVFDTEDPIITAYRAMFPSLFRDGTTMSDDLRQHVRYPELMLQMQATVYGLYHMTTPDVFYNREDLWTVASEAGMSADRQQGAQIMEPNFVLMKLPGEQATEFIEILPFTPANRNNLIGWIAGRSDGSNYGKSIVYNFPENRLVDGPLQIDARIEQNAQISGQLSLWNQQGSQVRRGSVIVIPIGTALLYAEPIYLQAQRSPMPELRLVVLALQDRLVYAPTFEAAMAAIFGSGVSTLSTQEAPRAQPGGSPQATPAPPAGTASDSDSLISEAARDLAEYQRLTAEGRLGEAGQRLEGLKQKLDQLNRRPR